MKSIVFALIIFDNYKTNWILGMLVIRGRPKQVFHVRGVTTHARIRFPNVTFLY